MDSGHPLCFSLSLESQLKLVIRLLYCHIKVVSNVVEYGYTNKISDIDELTDNPKHYRSSDLRRAIHDAKVVYEYGNKTRSWYEQVSRICNEELHRRGEPMEHVE